MLPWPLRSDRRPAELPHVTFARPARLRNIDALGSFPIQPIAARATLPAATRAAITGALLALRGPKLAAFGVTGLEAP